MCRFVYKDSEENVPPHSEFRIQLECQTISSQLHIHDKDGDGDGDDDMAICIQRIQF